MVGIFLFQIGVWIFLLLFKTKQNKTRKNTPAECYFSQSRFVSTSLFQFCPLLVVTVQYKRKGFLQWKQSASLSFISPRFAKGIITKGQQSLVLPMVAHSSSEPARDHQHNLLCNTWKRLHRRRSHKSLAFLGCHLRTVSV